MLAARSAKIAREWLDVPDNSTPHALHFDSAIDVSSQVQFGQMRVCRIRSLDSRVLQIVQCVEPRGQSKVHAMHRTVAEVDSCGDFAGRAVIGRFSSLGPPLTPKLFIPKFGVQISSR